MNWRQLILIPTLSLLFLAGCQESPFGSRQVKKQQVAIKPDVSATTATDREYIFTAPPRESYEDGVKQYGAIADYLSRMTGKKIVYVHQKNWLSYIQGMKRGDYDIVFDGPHFNAWRNRYLGHLPIARIDWSCDMKDRTNGTCKVFRPKWMLVYRKGTNTSKLAGRNFCLHAPPNFGTLSLLFTKFPNLARQPNIQEMQGWKKMVRAVRDNTNGCEFTVTRPKHIKVVDPEGKVLAYEPFDAFVHQGFTARADLPPIMIEQIRAVLTSDAGRIAIQAFYKRFVSKGRVLTLYKDSPEYDKPFAIFAKGYLLPWNLINSNQVAKR